MKHDHGCPVKTHTDAAKRASDAVNLHVSALGFESVHKWVAVRLSDGGSDGNLYDTKRDAVRHQLDEKICAYICVQPNGMNACRAESFLKMSRLAYEAGFRIADPDDARGGRDLIPRLTREENARQMARLK